MITVKTTE